MIFNPRDPDRQIFIRRFRYLGGFLRLSSGQQVIAGNIQRIRQQTQRFKARLTESTLVKTDGIQALSYDIRQRLLAHMFGSTSSLQALTKLDHACHLPIGFFLIPKAEFRLIL